MVIIEALTPVSWIERVGCHLWNCMVEGVKDSGIGQYIQLCQMYEAPVFVEHQSQNATFEKSILMVKGTKAWNQLPVTCERYCFTLSSYSL